MSDEQEAYEAYEFQTRQICEAVISGEYPGTTPESRELARDYLAGRLTRERRVAYGIAERERRADSRTRSQRV